MQIPPVSASKHNAAGSDLVLSLWKAAT